jgi:hypothetical protein
VNYPRSKAEAAVSLPNGAVFFCHKCNQFGYFSLKR